MRVNPPNYTQIPNELLDEWLPHLLEAELRVLLVIMRKTFGWHKIRDQISLSQLEKHTGMLRQAIINAGKSLQKKGLIKKTVSGKNGTENTVYELVIIDDSNSLYQCDKNTPPSVMNTPTKENPTKEKKENPLPPKKAFPPKSQKKEEASFKEKTKKQLKDVSDEEFEKAWKEYEKAPSGSIKSAKSWISAVISRHRHENESVREKETRILKHKLQAEEMDIRDKYTRHNSNFPIKTDHINAFRDRVEFSGGRNLKIVKYDVSDEEWQKETGWKITKDY